jgi:drug/metabolite transporter (DMT)-like permease
MTRLGADFSLLLAAAIWGSGFVAQKTATDHIGPLTFVGSRFLLSALLLAPLARIEVRRQKVSLPPGDWRLAASVGLSLFGAITLQQVGMMTTTASNAGFLTALYVPMVPIVAWCLTRATPSRSLVGACLVSVTGAWLLEQKNGAAAWNSGDLWILGSDLLSALQILLISQFLARNARPFLLSFLQNAICALLGLLGGLVFEPVVLSGILAAGPMILYAGLLSGGVAFTLQIVAQSHTPAAEAAIIMSLESVFAALAGAVLLGDHLTGTAILGCGLILLGVVLVQLAPLMKRNSLEASFPPPHDGRPESDQG